MYIIPPVIWLKKLNVTTQSIRRYCESGYFEKCYKTPGGNWRIGQEVDTYIIYYARVISKKQQSSLKSQIKEIKTNRNDKYYETITDIGSGFNFKRNGFNAILERCLRGEKLIVVVSNQDRFTRTGYEFFQWLLKRTGGELISINKTNEITEFDYDNLISYITVFCNAYYGKRNSNCNKKDKDISTK